MGDVQVVCVDRDVLRELVSPDISLPVSGYLAIEDERLIGSFGLTWGRGKCWLWFGHSEETRKHPFMVVRWAKRLLRQAVQLGETEVYTARDTRQERSAKLLGLLGFEYVGRESNPVSGGQEEVYRWRHCK